MKTTTALSIFILLFSFSFPASAQTKSDSVGISAQLRSITYNSAVIYTTIAPVSGHSGIAFVVFEKDTLSNKTQSWSIYGNQVSFTINLPNLKPDTVYKLEIVTFDGESNEKMTNQVIIEIPTKSCPKPTSAESKKRRKGNN